MSFSPLLFFFIGLGLLLKPINDLDELWNYNFAHNIQNGLIPYQDFNMIQTPLSAYISALCLKLLGDNLVSFRICGALLLAATFSALNKLAYRITDNSVISFVASCFLCALHTIFWIYNYNHINLLILILVMYGEYLLEQKNVTKPWSLYAWIGLLIGISPLIKQSTGVMLLSYNLAIGAYALFWKKRNLSHWSIRLICSFLPSGIYLLYLLLSGTFSSFYDYTIAGISTFTHRETWIDFLFSSIPGFVLGLVPILVTVVSIVTIYKRKPALYNRFLAKSLLLCWAGAIVSYPICDFVHACVAITPFVLPLLYCIGQINITKCEKIICSVFALMVLCFSLAVNVKECVQSKPCELPYFENLPIDPSTEQQIQTIEAYILETEKAGYTVIIADESAAAYTIPLSRYSKDFDLLLVGNVGTQSVEMLLWRKKAMYLVANDSVNLGKQSHTALIHYIKDHYRKVGEVLYFDVYASD